MRATEDLLVQARAAGLTLTSDGDRLIVRGPQEVLDTWREALREHKPALLAALANEAAEVAWRVQAFRAAIPARGPIWPPRIRNAPLTDAPGHCSLCGDELVPPLPRFPRCSPCVRALWLALNTTREGQVAA